jgi:flagellar L-ring protein precursor FlgH
MFWKYLLPFLLSATLFGCATSLKETKPLREDINKVYERPRIKYEGSLWQEDGTLSKLFMDHKAKAVGDIVTVSIVESSSASKSATTKTGRKSSISGGLESFFNLEKRYPGSHPFFNPFSSIKGGLESNFDGSGTTTRSGKLTAYITARVTEVLPNGNLRIEGSREVTVNNEKQFITLSGIIRPEDISSDNVILSTYISDARIVYSGVGVISDRQRPGWLARIFDWIWPF